MTNPPQENLQLNLDEVVWRDVGDELVILELSTSTYLTLNGSAKHIWESLAGGVTIDEVVEMLVGRYGITAKQARADAEAFISDLDDRQLLHHRA